jgi:hypothetical protein
MRILKTLLAIVAAALTAAPAANAAAPPNDDFDHPATLEDVPLVVKGTMIGATVEPGEPAHGDHTVWYAYRPSQTGRVALQITQSAGVEPRISVYTGSSLSSLTAVAISGGLVRTRVAFDAVAGETYRVAVSNYNCFDDGSGHLECHPGASPFEMTGTLAPLPRNDAFRHAQRVRFPAVYPGDLADATKEPGEDMHYSTRTLWYRFRPPRTAKVTMHFAATGYDCKMWLYRGTSLDHLHLVRRGGSDPADGPTEPMRVRVRRGVEYRLAVSCEEMSDGRFALNLHYGTIDDAGIDFAVGSPLTLRDLRSNGLPLMVWSRHAEHVTVELRVGRRTARELGLTSTVLGRRTILVNEIDPDSEFTDVRLTRAARRALRHVETLRAVARLRAADAVLTLPIRL